MKIDISKLQKDEKLVDAVGFWASKQSFYAFMLMTRCSRMELLIKCKALRVIEGERVNNVLYHLKPKHYHKFVALRTNLIQDCAKLVKSSPNSLKELSQLSLMDLQILFRSHNKMMRKLDEFEFFLFFKMTKYDYFLPMILTAPIFTRDLQLYDDSLLDAEKLVSNVTYEQNLLTKGQQIAKNELDLLKGKKSINEDDTYGKDSSLTRKTKKSSHSKISAASSVSSNSNIYNYDMKKAARLTKEEQEQQQEEKDEVLAGKMTYSLSQSLDGCHYLQNGQQGAKDMLIKYLGNDECLMLWQLPVVPNQNVSVILIWRENSMSLREFYSAKENIEARLYDESQGKKDSYKKLKESNKKKPNAGPKQSRKGENINGIVMEFCKSDLESSHLQQYIQRYLEAIHAEPLAKRVTVANDALRSLSCALSITELLLMIPLHVRSLVVCCPPVMRVIPWHLLFIEVMMPKQKSTMNSKNRPNVPLSVSELENQENEQELVELHLMEKYCIRLGPTLSLFELCSMSGSSLKQSVGYHRMCAVDGDDHEDLQDIPTNANNQKKNEAKKQTKHHNAAGIRGADLEVASCAHVWSADPEDYHILNNHAASYAAIETGVALNESFPMYTKFRDELKMTMKAAQREAKKIMGEAQDGELFSPDGSDLDDLSDNEDGEDDEEQLDAKAERILNQIRKKRKKNFLFQKKKNGNGEEDDEDEDDDDEDDEDKVLNEEDEIREDRKLHQVHVRSLTMCRVLHVCANKSLLREDEVLKNLDDLQNPLLKTTNKIQASIILPKSDPLNFQTSKRRILSAADVIKKLYLRNCALTVLSKFGISDDITHVKSPIIDLNWDFIEAFHLAGVSTVMFPLWEGSGQGIGTLAHVIFLIRFYSILPSRSHDRLSIIETVRKAQLWLKDVNANDVIAFIHKAPIPAKAKELIIEELESYVNSTVAEQKIKKRTNKMMKRPGEADEEENGGVEEAGNRMGGTHKFFTHFLNWGSFIVCGYGGNVHHPDLTADADESDALFGKHVSNETGFQQNISSDWNDKELDNIEFEASVLRMEGKITEAMELEKRIRGLKIARWKQRMEKMKQTGWKAGRQIMDTIDYFDKLFLDQDSDEVSVSEEDEDDDGGKGGKDGSEKKNDKKKGKDKGDKEKAKMKEMKAKNKKKPGDNSAMEGEDESEMGSPEQQDRFDINRLQFDNNASVNPNQRKKKDNQSVKDHLSLDDISQKNKPQFRPLDLDKNKDRPAIYDEWKSKVGDLNMEVKQPALPPDHFKKKKTTEKLKKLKPNLKKKENYEFQMMNAMKGKQMDDDEESGEDEDYLDDMDVDEDGNEVDDDEDDEDEEDEEDGDEDKKGEKYRLDEEKNKKKKKRKKNKKGGWKSIFGEVRSYAEIAQMISEQYPIKVLDQKLQNLENDKEKCIVS
jgi:hypothetical protein